MCGVISHIEMNENRLNMVLDQIEDSVTRLIIPEGVEVIEKKANFEPGKALEELIMPDSVVAIQAHTFVANKSLKNIKLSKNLRWIGKGAFEQCESLTEVDIPDSVEYIGECAFSQCKRLKYVHLPNNEKYISIKRSCFGLCDLRELKIPKQIKIIEKTAFYYNKNLEGFKVPDSLPGGLEILGYLAFQGCKNITGTLDLTKWKELDAFAKVFDGTQVRVVRY